MRIAFRGIFLMLLIGTSYACKQSGSLGGLKETDPERFRVAFYNLENLMDTLDDPLTRDEDFTPAGKMQWTAERYEHKLDRIAEVMDSFRFPELVGVAEIEHRSVLDDLCARKRLPMAGYQAISIESPDERGIDVGLLYRSSSFKPLSQIAVPVRIPLQLAFKGDTLTRDILYVKGLNRQGDTIHVFVNHWPSRSGGELQTDPLRQVAAQTLRQQVRPILAKSPDALILILGDFNDHPDNASVAEILGAQALDTPGALLFNPGLTLSPDWPGSHYYKEAWSLLDQIIYSKGFYSESSPYQPGTFSIYHPRFILFTDTKTKIARPNRTYGGTHYYGGYSDHLPVYIDFRKR